MQDCGRRHRPGLRVPRDTPNFGGHPTHREIGPDPAADRGGEERDVDRMSALDSGFYFAESENTPMHVGSVAVFEGPAPTYGDVVRLLLSKLPLVPRYRQRVREVPLQLGRPMWVDDPHFQILYHVRHTAVPSPGSDEQIGRAHV